MLTKILSIPKRLYLEILRVFAPLKYAKSIGVRFGKNCKFVRPRFGDGDEPYIITMGDHVEMSYGVELITHDGAVWVFREEMPDIEVFGPIGIGNNVFLGAHCMILPGVTIGDNCIIGACSVVTRDIPSNSVAVGVPAKVIKTIDEYKAAVCSKATYFRSLPPKQKKEAITKKFFGQN